MTVEADRTISTSLRARVPIIGIETAEEDRILLLMRELSANPRYPDPRKPTDEDRPVFVWSMTQGIKLLPENQPSPEDQPDCTQPITALEWFLTNWAGDRAADPAILVMLDIHPHLAKAAMVRLLRDA
nr:hypothetical protein [Anaerolineae bacterium]